MTTVEDIKRIIAYKKRRLEHLAKPNVWISYTKNMECGELREFKQSCIDDEIIIKALEKQMPKKPDLGGDGYDENGELIYDTGYCPNCRHIFEVDYDATMCCPVCGQALDWSDAE